MKNPKVYVIIPIYNVEPYLRECLDSVVNQTYRNLRIILVNDGSTDNSEVIAKEYLNDERVTLISKENGGASSARNVGLRVAFREGGGEDYIVFLDSDDFFELEFVEAMIQALRKNPQSIIALGEVQPFDQSGLFPKTYVDSKLTCSGREYLMSVGQNYFSFVCGGGIQLGFLRDRQIFFIEGIIWEDVPFGFQCFLEASKVCFFHSSFSYRQREGSVSCAKTFSQHKNSLIYKSQMALFDFFYKIYKNNTYGLDDGFLKHYLQSNAQIPVYCWIKDKRVSTKEELKPLVPFMRFRARIAYAFPNITSFLYLIKKKLKNV